REPRFRTLESAMPFVIQCPQCGQNLKVPDNLAGKKVRCSKCANSFLAEAVTGTPPASAPPPPRPPDEEPGDAGAEERRSRRGGSSGRPGRGGMLLTLGIISIVLALVTWICPCIPFVGIFIAPIVPVIGLGLGIPALLLGRGDLARIKAGEISPESQGTTQG